MRSNKRAAFKFYVGMAAVSTISTGVAVLSVSLGTSFGLMVVGFSLAMWGATGLFNIYVLQKRGRFEK